MNDNGQPESAHVAARRLADTIEELCARSEAPAAAALADVEDRARALHARIAAGMPRIERALDQPHALESLVRVRRARMWFALLTGAALLVELCEIFDELGDPRDDDDAFVLLARARRPAAQVAAQLDAAVRHAGEEDAALLVEPGHDEPHPCLEAPPRGAAWESACDVARAGTFLLARGVAGLPIDRGADALRMDWEVLYEQVVALKRVADERIPPDSMILHTIQNALIALRRFRTWVQSAQHADRTADQRQAALLAALIAIGEVRAELDTVRRLAGPEHEALLAAAGRAAAE